MLETILESNLHLNIKNKFLNSTSISISKTILKFNLDFMQFDFRFVGPISFPFLLKASGLVSQEGHRGIKDWKSHLMQKKNMSCISTGRLSLFNR